MFNYDDFLERKINELEKGAALEDVLAGLPDEAKELTPLILLAAAVREIPHPDQVSQAEAQQRQRMITAAQTNLRSQTRPAARNTSWKWLGGAALLAAAGGLTLLFIIALAGVGFWLTSQNRNTARVESLLGQVQVATNSAGTAWKNLSVGDRLHSGQRLRTLGASSATLVFFEGTHTFVSANSDLTFKHLSGSSGKALEVEIFQKNGDTWHKVTPLQGRQSFFLVDTPSGTASVHGTQFDVRVGQAGQAVFAVSSGEVRVKNNSSQVTLLPGQAAAANTSGEISDPTYLFNIQGSLLAIDENSGIWDVSGAAIQVSPETEITGAPQLSDSIAVSGRILADGTHLADSIEPAGSSDMSASFTGKIETIGKDLWTISGTQVAVTENTQLGEKLSPGVTVRVLFNILDDGSWLALKITALADEGNEPELEPTPTTNPRILSSLKFIPDELEINSCASSSVYTMDGTLKNTTSASGNPAINVQLGYLIDRGGEFVQSVELLPPGWEQIEAGQTVPFKIKVTMNGQWSPPADDREVKLRIFITTGENQEAVSREHLAVTIDADCKEATRTVTPTLTITPTGSTTPEPSFTPTIEATEEENAKPGGQCTGANPHPTGMKLAQRYGVPYEEIMGWFCNYHYGFGEIDLAYSLSRQTGKPVEEIFAMRASGLGWGQIKKQLAGQNDPQEKNPGKKDKKHP